MPAATSGTCHKPTKGKSYDIFSTVFFFEISGYISLPLVLLRSLENVYIGFTLQSRLSSTTIENFSGQVGYNSKLEWNGFRTFSTILT